MNQIKLSFLCAVLALSNRYIGPQATGIYAINAVDSGTVARLLVAAGQFFDANSAAAQALTELQLLAAANDFVVQFAQKNFASPLTTAPVQRSAAVSTAISTFVNTLT